VVVFIFSGTISTHQKKLQEAKFEIITSEASYINSLNVLEKHFISSLELCEESVLSKNDRRTLFSNLIPGILSWCTALDYLLSLLQFFSCCVSASSVIFKKKMKIIIVHHPFLILQNLYLNFWSETIFKLKLKLC
jgi:hypothetical protein